MGGGVNSREKGYNFLLDGETSDQQQDKDIDLVPNAGSTSDLNPHWAP